MPDYRLSAKVPYSRKYDKAFQHVRLSSDAAAIGLKSIFDGVSCNNIKYEVANIIAKEYQTSLDEDTIKDYKPWTATLFDRDFPDKKLKVTFAFTDKNFTSTQMLATLESLKNAGIQFQDSAERKQKIKDKQSPDTATWYNANDYLIGYTGPVRDLSRSDQSSVVNSPPADIE